MLLNRLSGMSSRDMTVKKPCDAKIPTKEKAIKIAGLWSHWTMTKKNQEFLLIPNPMSCMHVPPPPPNQMILVKMP